jgi:hypothetical protein
MSDNDLEDCKSEHSDVDIKDSPAWLKTKRGLLREARQDILQPAQQLERRRDIYGNIPAKRFKTRTRQPFLEWAQAATAQTLFDTSRHTSIMAARAELDGSGARDSATSLSTLQ